MHIVKFKKSMTKHIPTFALGNINANDIKPCLDNFILANDYALAQGMSFNNNPYVERGRMILLREARMGFVVSGKAQLEINLTEYHVETGMIILLPADALVCIKSSSDDYRLSGTVFKPNIQVNDIITLASDDDCYGDAAAIYNTLCTYCQHHSNRDNVVELLQRALLEHIRAIHTDTSVIHDGSTPKTRGEELFHRFKLLVSRHAHTERRVAFYAEKLCISPHHLMSVVQNISGQSVLHWVEHSAMLYAKVMLSTTDKSLLQISSDMNFPSTTAFCRWFKRIEGMSPGEYRDKNVYDKTKQ